MMAKETFLPSLVKALKLTDYIEIASVKKRHHEWSVLEDNETLKPFLDWFINSITHENCVTTDEKAMYLDLKCSNKLIPDEELDQQLQEYFNAESSGDISGVDYKYSIAATERELKTLESLEEFLNGQEKKTAKKRKAIDELEPFLKSELKEFEKLNSTYNGALSKHVNAWNDLKRHLSQEQPKELSLNKYLNLIFLNSQINKNLNEHLNNDFHEIKPTDGKISLLAMDYWVVYQKLLEIRNSIINTTSEIHGKSLTVKYLKDLEQLISISPEEISISDITKYLTEVPDMKENLTESLSIILEGEVNCLVKIQINNKRECSAFLEDRFKRLNKIHRILEEKRILNDALKFIIKRDKVVRDYQVDTLNQFYKNIDSLAAQHEQRIEYMKNYKNINRVNITDPNYKVMMKCLGAHNSDYKTLTTRITNFKESLHISYVNLEESLHSFQNKFTERLKELKKIDTLVIDGATRDIFGHIFSNRLTDPRCNLKRQRKVLDTFTKIQNMFGDVRNGSNRKDCIWLKFLESPKEFQRKLFEIEEETERLRERVKIEIMNLP